MQVQRSNSFFSVLNRVFAGRDTYKLENGCKVTMKKGTGNVSVDDSGAIKVSDAIKLNVYDSKKDNKIKVSNSSVNYVQIGRGNDLLLLDKCDFKDYKMFTGGTCINSYGKKKYTTNIMINGDFHGRINAQQGGGSGYGDKKSHKDNILINGDNYGEIFVDTPDKVAVKGEQKGSIKNMTIYYI